MDDILDLLSENIIDKKESKNNTKQLTSINNPPSKVSSFPNRVDLDNKNDKPKIGSNITTNSKSKEEEKKVSKKSPNKKDDEIDE